MAKESTLKKSQAASTALAPTPKPGGLSSLFSASTGSIRKRRADKLVSRIRLEQEGLVNELKRQLAETQDKLECQCDLSPRTTTDLSFVSTDFNAREWVLTVQDLNESVANLEFKLSIAEKTLVELNGITEQ